MRRPPPDPRLARILRGLAQAEQLLDDLRYELVEYLRSQDTTLDDIGECYDPPVARQTVADWLETRRLRRQRGQ